MHSDVVQEKTLAYISPKDKRWDQEKLNNSQLVEIFRNSSHPEKGTLRKWATRLEECCKQTEFARVKSAINENTGEIIERIKLITAHFCHVRTCPICMERRKLYNITTFCNALPAILEKMPKYRFAFLTLTVKNCHVSETREVLNLMNKAWDRLCKRTAFMRGIRGWVRSTEVTNEVELYKTKTGRVKKRPTMNSHPHFHVMLLVPEYYFSGKYYINQADWVRMWRESLRVDYDPIVDIRVIKPKNALSNDVKSAAIETLKYAIKSSDMLRNPDWACELALQIKGLKFLSSGGVFKNAFKDENKITDEDLIHLGDVQSEEIIEVLFFLWDHAHHKYFLSKVKSKEEYEQDVLIDKVIADSEKKRQAVQKVYKKIIERETLAESKKRLNNMGLDLTFDENELI